MKHLLSALVVAGPLTLFPLASHAVVVGFLGNFDVINDTGSTAHGFEIELEGLHSSDISDTFGGEGRGFPSGRGFDPNTSVQRYGAPTITEYSNGAIFGTRVTYRGLWDGSKWDYGTLPTTPGSFVTPGDNCWSGGGVGYGPSTPCDHFGVGTVRNATKTTYSWLLEVPGSPGVLNNGVVNLPAPAWEVIPPAPPAPGQVAAPPAVGVQIRAPEPENEAQFGEAIWVKVFTTELEGNVKLEDLVRGNANMDQVETEVEWQLLQTDPDNPAAGQLESGYGVPVGPKAASILRRYEFYKYAGEYDAENHEARPAGTDSLPGDGDLGTYIGAQNGAANLNVAALVPEPGSYALLLAGLAVVGFTANRRRFDTRQR